jgi:hypothetical protein
MSVRFSGSLLNAFAMLALASCAHGSSQTSMMIHLDWRTTNDVHDASNEALRAFNGQTVAIVAGTDHRPSPATIGRNVEDRAHPMPVTTNESVPAFVTGYFGQILRMNGINVVASGATRTIQVDVMDFDVEEDNTYNAHAIFNISLQDKSGAVMWSGTTRGKSKRFGKSFDEENYLEALSNATSDAVLDLLKDDAFLAACAGRGAATATTATSHSL